MASASRQKPDATGPTSVSRTIHGPSARIEVAEDQRRKGVAPGGRTEDDRDCCIVASGR